MPGTDRLQTTPDPNDLNTDPNIRDLAWLAEERWIVEWSHWWPKITLWQRKGWVRLRWEETKSGMRCFVRATPAGLEAAHGK